MLRGGLLKEKDEDKQTMYIVTQQTDKWVHSLEARVVIIIGKATQLKSKLQEEH